MAKSYTELIKEFDLNINTNTLLLYQDYKTSYNSKDFRIITLEEPGTGTHINYFFKRINTKWYLVKYENLGV